MINNKGRWSYKDDNAEESGVDIYVDGDEWVATTYPCQYSVSVQRIRAAQLVNYANNCEELQEENRKLKSLLERSLVAYDIPNDYYLLDKTYEEEVKQALQGKQTGEE